MQNFLKFCLMRRNVLRDQQTSPRKQKTEISTSGIRKVVATADIWQYTSYMNFTNARNTRVEHYAV